jgi:hypothetical protein
MALSLRARRLTLMVIIPHQSANADSFPQHLKVFRCASREALKAQRMKVIFPEAAKNEGKLAAFDEL